MWVWVAVEVVYGGVLGGLWAWMTYWTGYWTWLPSACQLYGSVGC